MDAEPVTDYITDVDERCRLFRELQQMAHGRLNATMFAFVMVAPLPGIKSFISVTRAGRCPWVTIAGFDSFAHGAMRFFLPPGNRQAKPATLPKSVDDVTSGEPRDGQICVFSGTNDPATAHIFPSDPSAKTELFDLNSLLEFFWGADKSTAWRRLYEDGSITQSSKNRISMDRQLRFWLDSAKCALKPLHQTQKEVVVQWHRLRKTALWPRTEIREDLDILEQAGLIDQRWGANLAHLSGGFCAPIQTGQTFVIRAEDPKHLPSFELLELQWNPLRVAAICGAAEATDEDYQDRFDDGYGEDYD